MKKTNAILKTTIYLLILLGSSAYAQTQSIGYSYDNVGNRIIRQLVITTPCDNCPPPTDPNGRMAAPLDTTQVLAAQHGLSVFPNPTQDKVNLTLSNLKDDETTSVVVTDEGGKMVYSAKNLQSQNEVNVSGFNNGTYFFRITMGKDVMVYKVMKVQ